MKSQFGFLQRDGSDACPPNFAHDDGIGIPEISGKTCDGPVFMAFRGNKLTWEEESETQPYQEWPFTLTFDGRLDNRAEVSFRCGLHPAPFTPDPVLILQAYQLCGDELLPNLIGEFALTLWNSKTRTLIFARSFDGARPLYYILQQDKLMWASTLRMLLCNSTTETRINETYILEFLSSVPHSEHTPFAQVGVVPPGAILRFVNDAFWPAQTIWKPPEHDLRIRSDLDYEEEFRENISDAIAVRLRAKGVIFAELSGGLDSSSITLIGHNILSAQNRDPQTLRTMSCIYNKSRTCDETSFIRIAEKSRGVPSIYVQEEEQSLSLALKDTTFTGVPNPLRLHPGRYATYVRHMKVYDARILLTGVGGDDLFGCNPDGTPLIADRLLSGKFLRMHQECKVWSRFSGRPYLRLLLGQVLPFALAPILPRGLQYHSAEFPEFLTQECKQHIHSKTQEPREAKDLRLAPSYRAQRRSVQLLFDLIATGQFAEFPQIYFSHPYTHRPLIEFCLRTPLSQFVRSGEFRSLMRRALRHTLPSKIVERKTKTSMDEAILRAIEREWDGIGDVREWEICRRGYIDAARFQQLLRKLRVGIQSHIGSVVNAVALEQWFRSLKELQINRVLTKTRSASRPSLLRAIGGSTHANSIS